MWQVPGSNVFRDINYPELFVVFLTPGLYFETGQGGFLPYPFQFINHTDSVRYTVRHIANVVK
jgi:hypothetical protein